MGRDKLINLHSVIPSSRVNGPGKRMVVFFQGCTRKCPCCFNPDTHSFQKAHLYTSEDIFKQFLLPDTEGITVSGGEPFNQAKGLLQLLKTAKEEYGLSTVVYTGFSYEELLLKGKEDPTILRQAQDDTNRVMVSLSNHDYGNPPSQFIFNYIDVLIDGAYKDNMKEPTLLARGSTNQRLLFFSDRYQEKDFYMPAKVEIIISSDGTVRETGFSKVELYNAA
ncbi:MAG: 4Fe-4S single cluster domain-containing protein [Nitrospira sp.]|nr:4Fe-4S single cluster domain-containing protein [Nitrospira sp.]